jgi:hypothetical protein
MHSGPRASDAGAGCEIAQGRYRDLEEGYDLAVEDATVRLSRLPILDKGQVVADTPALLMRHALAGEARAQSFAIDDICLEGLEIDATNDHGTLAIKHLSLTLAEDGRRARDVSGGTFKGIGIAAQGKLHLFSRPPAEQSLPSSWRELAGIDLADATAHFDELYLGSGPDRLEFEDTHFETRALPLARGRSFVTEMLETSPERLLSEMPFQIAARGQAISMSPARLESFDLALGGRDGKLAATLARSRLKIERMSPDTRPVGLTTWLSGEGTLALEPSHANASGKTAHLRKVTAEQLDLKAEKGTFNTPWGPLSFDHLGLTVDRLPLVVGEGPLDWTKPKDLLRTAGNLHGRFVARGIRHDTHEIPSLALTFAGDGDRLRMESLDAVVANARLAGDGVVTMVEDRYPWSFHLATDKAAIAPILELFATDISASGTVSADAELSGTDFAMDRIELGTLSLDLDEARAHVSGDPVVLRSAHLEVRDLPVVADGRTLLDLRGDGSQRLLSTVPFRLTASGSSISAGPVHLGNYGLVLANRNGELAIRLAKGRLKLAAKDSADPIKALSATLKGQAVFAFKAHKRRRAAQSLPLASLTARKLKLDANRGKLTTAVGEYNIDSLTVNVDQLPLIVGGRLLDLTRTRNLSKVGSAARLQLQASGIEHREGVVKSLVLVVVSRKDRLLLEDMVAQIEDSTLSAQGEVQLRGMTSPWRLRLAGIRIRLAPLMAWFGAPFRVRGNLKLRVDLRGTDFDPGRLRKGLGGLVRMEAADVDIEGVDLDKVLTHLEHTQDGGLLDVAAYALAGPAGPLLVTTADYKNLVDSAKARGRSRLLRMRSDLEIERGTIHIQDVAMVTPNHRLAVKGSLSTDPNGALDLQIATLEPDGCPIYLESVGGTVASPRISEAALLVKAIGRPIQSALGILGRILPLSCNEPFYTGAVKPQPIPAGERRPEHPDETEATRPREPPASGEKRRKAPDVNLFLDHDL